MTYLGNSPTTQSFISGTDYFSGTGSQTAFTLTRTVNSVNDIEVVINNVVQQPSTSYTLSGTTITFTSAPSSGTNNIYVRYLATTMQSITVPANSITRTQLDSNLQAGFQGRNKIINGHMVIDQRNAGSAVTITTDGTYTLDRWRAGMTQASKFSVQQSTTAPVGFANSLKVTSLSAYSVGSGDIFLMNQRIEGFNTADLNWGTANAKTVTLSFQVYSSLTGTFGGSITNAAENRFYPFSYTVSAANTWTTVSITITGDTSGTWVGSTNGIGMQVWFGLGGGSTYSGTAGAWTGTGTPYTTTGATSVVGTNGATFYITGIQLEEGTTATSFERESYSVTLQKCYRYYWRINSNNYFFNVLYYAPNSLYTILAYPVTMRAAPTSAIVSGTDYYVIYRNSGSDYINNLVLEGATTQTTALKNETESSGTGGQAGICALQNAAGYIALTAEL